MLLLNDKARKIIIAVLPIVGVLITLLGSHICFLDEKDTITLIGGIYLAIDGLGTFIVGVVLAFKMRSIPNEDYDDFDE